MEAGTEVKGEEPPPSVSASSTSPQAAVFGSVCYPPADSSLTESPPARQYSVVSEEPLLSGGSAAVGQLVTELHEIAVSVKALVALLEEVVEEEPEDHPTYSAKRVCPPAPPPLTRQNAYSPLISTTAYRSSAPSSSSSLSTWPPNSARPQVNFITPRKAV